MLLYRASQLGSKKDCGGPYWKKLQFPRTRRSRDRIAERAIRGGGLRNYRCVNFPTCFYIGRASLARKRIAASHIGRIRKVKGPPRAAAYQSWPLRGPTRYDAAQAVFNGRPATSRPGPAATLVRKASGYSIKANGHFINANLPFYSRGALAVFKARLGSRT